MIEYALLIDSEFKEIRYYESKPQNIPHKKITWHEVIREQGVTSFTGVENDSWIIRTSLPTFSELKQQKLDQLASIRWQKETSGTTFNGYNIATDPISQTKYVGAVVATQIDSTIILNWKMSDGTFIELDATDVTAIAMAIRAHIQACFDKEAELRLLVKAAANQEELDVIDITIGWPN